MCFGSEATGATPELLHAADKRVYLPLHGFADSLNLSVAAALCIQRLMLLCPKIVGAMSENERRELRKVWYPKMARNDADRERYTKMAEDGIPRVVPFSDLRRADKHRSGWLSKKTAAKNSAAGFDVGIGS